VTSLELERWRGHNVPVLSRDEISRYNVQDYLNWIQYSNGYMGAPTPVTTYGNRPAEPISSSFEGFVWGMLYADGPVAAVEAYRLRVFGQAPLLYQDFVDGRPGDFFDDPALDQLREPWPGGNLSDLMKRSLIYGDFAGNSFGVDLDDEIVLLRPDWVEIILEKRDYRGGQVGWRQRGIMYYEGGLGVGDGVAFLPGEYFHFVPGLPDPLATFRGMSWLTPLVREVQADKAASDHKVAFFENSASPNLAVSLPKEITPKQFEEFVEKMDAKHKGVQNTGRTLYTAGGADVTVIGANMQQMDFSSVQGRGETRVANAGGVPPVLLSFAEGMQGSSLNAGNYTAAKRNFTDTTMRDLWSNKAGSLQKMDRFRPPRPKSRLWYVGRDIPFMHEDAQDLAQIQQTQASTVNSYITAGFKPDTAVAAVERDDLKLLEHTGLTSVQLMPPGSQDADGDGVPDAEAQASEDYEAALDEFRSELEWRDEILRKAPYPGQRYRHGWIPVVGLVGDALKLEGRMDLPSGESLESSGHLKLGGATIPMAWTTGPSGRRLRIASVEPGDEKIWTGRNLGATTVLDEAGVERLRDGLTSMSETAERVQAEADRLNERLEDLASQRSEINRRQYAGLTKAQGRQLSRLEERLEYLDGSIKRLDEDREERAGRIAAEVDPEERRFLQGIQNARDANQANYRAERVRLQVQHDELTAGSRTPLTAGDLADLAEVDRQVAAANGELDRFADQTLIEGSVSGEWGDVRWHLGTDEFGQPALSVEFPGDGEGDGPQLEPAELDQLLRMLGVEVARSYIERRDYYDLRDYRGRFRKASDRVGHALNEWLKGNGNADDPLGDEKEFSTASLRSAAKELGVTVPRARRGASEGEKRDLLKLALLKDARARFRGDRDGDGESGPVRMTLQSPKYRDVDVGVYREANGKVGLYRLSGSSSTRGARIATFDDLEGLEAWGRDNGEPRVAEWAASERGAAKPTKRAPAKKAQSVDFSDPALLESEHAQAVTLLLEHGDTPDRIVDRYIDDGLSPDMARLLVNEAVAALTAQGKLPDSAATTVRRPARVPAVATPDDLADLIQDPGDRGAVARILDGSYIEGGRRLDGITAKVAAIRRVAAVRVKVAKDNHRSVPTPESKRRLDAAEADAVRIIAVATALKKAPTAAHGGPVPARAVLRPGATSSSSTWRVAAVEGLQTSVPGAASAVSAYLRHPASINDRLRTPGTFDGDATTADRHIAAMDRVMDQSTLDRPLTLYRGTSTQDIAGLPAGSAVGHEWTDAGYASTSTKRGVAEHSFAGRGRVLLTVRAPEGTPALQIDGLGETEVLLGRGQTFRVVADHGLTPEGARNLEVELGPAPAKAAPRKAAKSVTAKAMPEIPDEVIPETSPGERPGRVWAYHLQPGTPVLVDLAGDSVVPATKTRGASRATVLRTSADPDGPGIHVVIWDGEREHELVVPPTRAFVVSPKSAPAKATPRPKREPLGDPAAKLSSLRALGDREAARDELDLLLLDDLKTLAKAAGVATSGRKRDVVDRITAKVHPVSTPLSDKDIDTRSARLRDAGTDTTAIQSLLADLDEPQLRQMAEAWEVDPSGRRVDVERRLVAGVADFNRQQQPAGSLEDRVAAATTDITAAYRRLIRAPGEYVKLADLRRELPGHDREAVDEALRRLSQQRGINVLGEVNPATRTEADDAAAVTIGQRPAHLIAFENVGPSRRNVPEAEVQAAAVSVIDAYHRAPEGLGGWVKLADLRRELGDHDRDAVDAALVQIGRQPGVFVISELHQETLTPADRAAAVSIGGQSKHQILIEPDADLSGVTGDREQSARDRQSRLETARHAAEALVDLDTMAANGGSAKALSRRVDTRVRMGALTEDEGARLRAALSSGGMSENERRLRAEMGDVDFERRMAGDRAWIKYLDEGVDTMSMDELKALAYRWNVSPKDLRASSHGTGKPLSRTALVAALDRSHRITPKRRPELLVDDADVDGFHAALADILSSRGATTHHTPGDVVPFDASTMRHQGDRPSPGTPVQVVSPGASMVDSDGTVVTLVPTVVMDAPDLDSDELPPPKPPIYNQPTPENPLGSYDVPPEAMNPSPREGERLQWHGGIRQLRGTVVGEMDRSTGEKFLVLRLDDGTFQSFDARVLRPATDAPSDTSRSLTPKASEDVTRAEDPDEYDRMEDGEDPSLDDIFAMADEDDEDDVERAAGKDVKPGNDRLHHFWTVDPEGRAKWVDSPKPWTTLVAHLTRHVGLRKAKIFASRWFIEVFGYAAGSDKNRVAHGHPPRGNRVGPG